MSYNGVVVYAGGPGEVGPFNETVWADGPQPDGQIPYCMTTTAIPAVGQSEEEAHDAALTIANKMLALITENE